MIHVEFDNRRWQQTLEKLAATTRKTTQEVLKQTARLVVEDAIAMTPPIPGRRGFGKGNANVGERTIVGRNAVRRDIEKTMWPVGQLTILSKKGKETKASASLRRYLNKGDAGKLTELLRTLGFHRFKDVAVSAQRHMHEDQRFNGRVHSNFSEPNLIISGASIRKYVAERQKMVWKGVSGWNKAAFRLKARPRYWPAAARKLYQPGHYAESAKGSNDVWYEFANKSRYMQSKGREMNIMRSAFQGVQNRLIKDLEVKLQMAHAKAAYPP